MQHLEELLKSCIHCGICLPSCPTYKITGNEGHSPRGRLYIMNAGKYDDQAIEYLDACLSCAACQSICPSGVQYLDILDKVREKHQATNYNRGAWGQVRKLFWKYLINDRKKLYWIKIFLKQTQFLLKILSPIIPKLKTYQRLSLNLRHQYQEIQTNTWYYSDYPKAQNISLSLGCIMDTLYNHIHWDTIQVLNACGYHVWIPSSNCCGALAYHSGEPKIGEEQLSKNLESFKQYPTVINSAGCSAFIKNHSSIQILELIEAIDQAPRPLKNLKLLKTLKATYHPACHINHQQKLSSHYEQILNSIEGLELKELPDADLCCGSAGFYNIIQSDFAEQIGELKSQNIKQTKVQTVLTANPGCISQIQAHLGVDYKVVHPIQVIAEALDLSRNSSSQI